MGGRVAQWIAFSLHTQRPRFDSPRSQNFSDIRIIRCCRDSMTALLRNSGQRLDDVIQTHLVLASGKLVLQKNCGKLR